MKKRAVKTQTILERKLEQLYENHAKNGDELAHAKALVRMLTKFEVETNAQIELIYELQRKGLK